MLVSGSVGEPVLFNFGRVGTHQVGISPSIMSSFSRSESRNDIQGGVMIGVEVAGRVNQESVDVCFAFCFNL